MLLCRARDRLLISAGLFELKPVFSIALLLPSLLITWMRVLL
jgi:hypothetical protein